ncbi:MAG TPA: CvpA family protein [Anaerohalosphaeraceae bacterium]|jgi:hypothetical protein|nr:CvpA family protein [Anaerohalosphaeraceae bacterium]HRT49073.1 CvpA family protein [Anaerohalosphaeraceae bacterium]HRT85674.1 CvpA family protein [Anaerohalosphaeraceae bacterium]
MLILLEILIIILLTMAQFYLKNKAMTSFVTMMASIFGLIVAFAYYEPVAGFLIDKGYGGQWAQSGIFFVLFIVTSAIIRTLGDLVWDPDVEFAPAVTKGAAAVCGLVTGLIIAGMVHVSVAMTPGTAKQPYKRFGDGQSAITNVSNAKKPPIAADGMVSGLFSWISKGSLSSSKSFAVYHAGYLDQLHLNRYKTKAGVYRVAGKTAISVPRKGLRRLEGDDNLIIVRMEVKRGDIKSGGASAGKGDVTFMLGQVRLICKKQGAENTRGAGTAIYPEGRVVSKRDDPENKDRALTGLMSGRVVTASTLDEVVTLGSNAFKGSQAPVDLAFKVPAGMTPVLLQFKDNVVVSVPAVEAISQETEAALSGEAAPSDSGGARPAQPSDPNY